MVAGKSQAQNNNGQASPAPFQNRASENEQDFYPSVRPISGDFDPVAGNSSDRKNEVNHDQNTNTNLNPGGNPCDSRIDHNPGSYNRTDDEVKNEQRYSRADGVLGDTDFHGLSGLVDAQKIPAGIAPSARLSAPANQASFDAGKLNLSHVQNNQENEESATCANPPQVEEKPNRLTGRELANWAMENYAVDPIQNSKNRWRIRLRCRKTGCKHEGHLGLKTVSFMSDSAFKKLTRSERKYELWKKSIIAENAAKCHGYGGSSSGRNDERRA